MQRFPLRRGRWALPFLVILSGPHPYAEVGEGVVRVRMGLLGRADVPVELIDRVGTITWPWWSGVGARIARGLVAFVAASGGAIVLVELSEPVTVRAPLSWKARSIAIGAEDVQGMIEAIAQARRPPSGAG